MLTSPTISRSFKPVKDLEDSVPFSQVMSAYEDMIRHTSTEIAPWYVVPADRKWFTRLVVSAAIIDTIQSLDPRFPAADPQVQAELSRVKASLEAEQKPKAAGAKKAKRKK